MKQYTKLEISEETRPGGHYSQLETRPIDTLLFGHELNEDEAGEVARHYVDWFSARIGEDMPEIRRPITFIQGYGSIEYTNGLIFTFSLIRSSSVERFKSEHAIPERPKQTIIPGRSAEEFIQCTQPTDAVETDTENIHVLDHNPDYWWNEFNEFRDVVDRGLENVLWQVGRNGELRIAGRRGRHR